MREFARIHDDSAVFADDEDFCVIRRAALGDEAAQRALVCRLAGRVKNTCRYLIGSIDAEDSAQSVLMEIVKSAPYFRGECSVEYWADRITIHTIAKQYKKKTRRKELIDSVWDPGPDIISIEQQVAMRRVQGRLVHHFSNLSEKQRRAVVLHYLYGYEISEIADITEARINAVRSRLRKGLTQLRRHILADPCLREWVKEGTI